MKQNVTLVLLGVLIGAMLMLAVPSQAHHKRSFNRLERRISNLEFRLDRPSGCNTEDAVTWDSPGALLPQFDCRDIRGEQVGPPSGCSSGDPAVWEFSGLSC